MSKSRIISIAAIGVLLCLAFFLWNNFSVFCGGAKAEEKQVQSQVSSQLIKSPEKVKEEKLKSIISSMSNEQKVGQMMIVGFSGKEPDYYISKMITSRHIGGVILFSRNIGNASQVIKTNNALQKMSIAAGSQPLFIAVDQECGLIDRFKGVITGFPSETELGRNSSPAAVELAAKDVAEELKSLGVNVNFAPVLDIGYKNSIMSPRVYGMDAAKVSDFAIAAIKGYSSGGVIPCAKHFPGLGRATVDPHKAPVVIKADLKSLQTTDFLPFKRAVDAKVAMVMVSHAVYPALDKVNMGSVSPVIQTQLLRKTMGFDGIIISDDMEMGAALANGALGEVAVKAVLAGTDIILVCHTPEKQVQAYDGILAAVNSGRISEERINESVYRILSAKYDSKLETSLTANPKAAVLVLKSAMHKADALKVLKKVS